MFHRIKELLNSKKKAFYTNRQYTEYAKAFEQTLRELEAHLHDSDDQSEIINKVLETACNFYKGDWAGFVEVDLDLGLWTPYVWFNTNDTDKTKEMLQEFESADFLNRWYDSMRTNQAIMFSDINNLSDITQEEYQLYKRLHLKSLIAVPVKPRPTGFLIIRNPQQYLNQSSLIQMLAFVVLAAINEQKLIQSARMNFLPDTIEKDTDIVIHLFGNFEIYTFQGVQRETDLKSPKICKLLAYMLLNPKESIPTRELVEAVWGDESIDWDNPGNKLKTLIYRQRDAFRLICQYQLIDSAPKGYRLNPKLRVVTDLQQFDYLLNLVKQTSSVANKIELLKNAIKLYRGDVMSSLSPDHWLMLTVNHYRMKYRGVVNELLKLLGDTSDYQCVHAYASQALLIDPDNLRCYYWMLWALDKMGATELVRSEVNILQQKMEKEDYEQIMMWLNESDIEN